MTLLQQMAFDRIATLNKECQTLIPRRWGLTAEDIAISIENLKKLTDNLYEQENIIEALWEEERKDGCEETI